MASKIKPLHKLSRSEVVSFVLRSIALKLDPKLGRLTVLANEIPVHEVTLSGWIKQGYVPQPQVEVLQKKFGDIEHVTLDVLCPTQFRR